MAFVDTQLIETANKLDTVNTMINSSMCPFAVKITKAQMKKKSYQSRTIFKFTDNSGKKSKIFHCVQCKKTKFDSMNCCYKHHESVTKGSKHIYRLTDIIDKCTIVNGSSSKVSSSKEKTVYTEIDKKTDYVLIKKEHLIKLQKIREQVNDIISLLDEESKEYIESIDESKIKKSTKKSKVVKSIKKPIEENYDFELIEEQIEYF